MVTRPFDTPNSSVKASAVQKVAPPSISTRNDSGRKAMDTRPTEIGCHLRASVRSQMRPATWAKPLREARNTAVASASPVASKIGTRCTASAPNTTAVVAPINPNSTMPMVRAVPSSGGSAGLAPASLAACAGPSWSRRASPNQCNGKQTRKLTAANTSSVVRQPTLALSS